MLWVGEGGQQAPPGDCQAFNGAWHGLGHSNPALAASAPLGGGYLGFRPSCPPGHLLAWKRLLGRDAGGCRCLSGCSPGCWGTSRRVV